MMNKHYPAKGGTYVLPRIVFSLLLLFTIGLTNAFAQLSNVPVTGFNSDQVANGVGAPTGSTTAVADGGVDNGGYTFIDGTYGFNGSCTPATTNILPANNQISSTAAPGLIYTLQPYNGNNALRVPATGVTAGTATLTVTTPVSASTIYLLSVSGGGAIASGVTVTVTFTDNTTQVFTNQSTEDWCNTTSSATYSKITTTQYNRIQATTATNCTGIATCQYFAEMILNLNGANYGKLISSIAVNKTTATNVMNVYAVGVKAPCVAPVSQPTSLSSTGATTSSVTGSFTDASPLPSGYLVVRYPQGTTTPTAPVDGVTYTPGQTLGTGTVVSAGTSTTFTANALSGGTSYEFFVYSYATGTTCGGPVYLTASPLTNTLSTNACGGSLSGTIAIGPLATYTNITSAIAAMGAGGVLSNTVFELQAGYDPSTETFPLVFPSNPCISSTKQVTIRPASGVATPIVITSAASVTMHFDGASYITIDGRPGGTGTAKMLSIINTAGTAIQFTNDANNNVITYCDVQGQNTSATSSALSGVIYFGTANGTLLNGNDNNTISFSDIHSTATGFSAIGISSYGSNVTTPVSAWNDNNTINNCNIYDFFSATLPSTGIKLDGGSNAFTISNNHLYQTATRTFTTGNQHRGFWLTPTTAGASGFIVLNNYIGGNDATGAGTWTLAGSVVTNFWGMDINHSGTAHTSVQGNTITNISLTSTTTTANDLFRGISTGNNGHVDIGTVTGNTIGSSTINGAITLVSGSGSTSYGIKCASTSASTDSISVANNIIGGINASASTATGSTNIHGIGVTTGSYTFISNNAIGSLTVPNSINAMNAATSIQSVYGISVAAGLYTSITNNTIANLRNGYVSTSTSALTRGISMTSSTNSVVTGNLIRGIATSSTSTGSGTTAALTGIFINPSNPTNVSGNNVDSLVLANGTATTATYVEGLYVNTNGTTPTHTIAKNFIHHFNVANTANNNAFMVGININGGSNIISNNMVQLGIKPDGTSLDAAMVIRGIYLNTTTATNMYHNTVYIGGTGVTSVVKATYALQRNATSGTHDIKNNIFVNNRSNATTGGKHYQVFLNTTTGLTLGNNVYFGNGTGALLGSLNNGTNDVASITSGWLAGDLNSVAGDPQFINPAGGMLNSVTPVDLHINPSIATPVESAGTPIAAITEDFDGNLRSTNTPVDIGADAGLFTVISMTVDSTVVEQVTAGTLLGATNQAVISVKIYTKGTVNPLQLTALKFNTAGTTSTADITNARVYSTGSGTVFNTTTQYGTTVPAPNGAFYATGTVTMNAGLNCFWVAYDVAPAATANNFIDARLDSVGFIGNAPANILVNDPAGNRKISAPLAGNYTVGSGQNYTTITAAMADLALLGVSGPVTFTLTDATYSTGETFPIVVGPYFGASPTNSVTIIPASGITATINGNVANPLFRLDGVKYFAIDGRQAGTGTPKSLIVINDNTGGSAVNFVNDAVSNTLRYAVFRGASNTATTGVINFGTGVVTGNDSNLIDYCDIADAATTPATLVQSLGSTDVVAKYNDYNTVSNCNVFNFWHASAEGNAFKISNGNNYWVITGNSIYQTATRTGNSGYYTFNFQNTGNLSALNGLVVTNNYIGGSAPLCGGTPWTQTSGPNQNTYFNLGNVAMSRFSNNTIANYDFATTSASATGAGVWNVVQYINGLLNIDSNMIGSLTNPNSIIITAANLGMVLPISATANTAGTFSIRDNKISGIRVTGGGTASVGFSGINITSATSIVTYNVERNDIGTVEIIALASSSTSAQSVMGINNTSTAVMNIRNNTVHNLNNLYSGTGTGQTSGIRSSGGLNTITGNVIDSLANASPQTGTGNNAAVMGISHTSTNGNGNVSSNIVYALGSTATTGITAVTGIYNASGTGDVIARNLVHSLSTVSTGALVNGIQYAGGTSRVYNNMIRLGVDAAGNNQTGDILFTGLLISGGNARVFFNTSYVGGTGVTGAANSFALNRTSTGTDSLFNNIIVNERTGGTGNHYAIGANSSTGLTSNFNLYYNPAGTTLGFFNGVTRALVSDWKTASGVDISSNSGNPSFILPSGNAATVDLHITGTTPIEGAGLPITGITDDFDGDLRSGFTPTDIGADAGNFTVSDIFAPAISFTPVVKDTIGALSLVLNNFATITDASGVNTTTDIPRIYYKKKTDNNVFAGNTAADNGWKYAIASNTTSPFSFTLDYSILFGGALTLTDTVLYFVAAQDINGNIGANPAGGFSATSVSAVVSAPTNPSFYRVRPGPLNGTYIVGTGQTAPNFVTITDAMATVSDVGVGGPVTFTLADAAYNTAETFPININAISGTSAVNTVTIKPAAGISPVISGNNGTAIFMLNGCDYVIFDGSNNGTTSKDMTIFNASGTTTSAVIWGNTTASSDAATNNTIKNTVITGSGRASTLVGIGFGGTGISITSLGNGNNNNSVLNCTISACQYGVYNMGASASNKNQGTTISNNNISINSKAGVFAGFNNNMTINGNRISNVTNGNTAYGIALGSVTGNTTTISGNEVTNVTVSGNVIDSVISNSTWTTMGISVVNAANAGTTLISNNMISRLNGTATASDITTGIYVGGGANVTTNIYHNTVNLAGALSGSSRAFAIVLDGNNSVMNVKNNIFINEMSGTSANTFAIGVNYNNFSNLDENYNNFINTGTTSAFSVTGGIFGATGTTSASLAAWKTATGKGANSKNKAVVFMANNNLHLDGTSLGDFDLAGTPLAAVTTDIDGDARAAVYPYMGADENLPNPLPVELSMFAATAKGNDVYLTWATASEKNNKGFEIERSVDGIRFEKIDFVKGAGNSNRVVNYSLPDVAAFTETGAGVIYYRLKQIDLNGKYAYSQVVVVSQADRKTEATVYPNPFNNELHVSLVAEGNTVATISITDLSGKEIRVKEVTVSNGVNHINIDHTVELESGAYFIKVEVNGNATVKKLIKH